jgi:hypothetical protein
VRKKYFEGTRGEKQLLFCFVLLLVAFETHIVGYHTITQWIKLPENLAKIRNSRAQENALTTVFRENINVGLL